MTTHASLPTINWVDWSEGGSAPRPLWPLERLLDAIAAAGCPGVGLDHYTLSAYESAGGRIDDLGGLLRSRGLACTDVSVLPVGQPGVLKAAERLAWAAAATGAPLCIAAVYAPMPRAIAIRELDAVADRLGAAGARLALEFASYGGLTELSAAIALADAVGWDRCGLLVDTWHFFRSRASWTDLRRLDRDRISMLHLNDGSPPFGDDPVYAGRFRRLPVGAGTFPIHEFLEAVTAGGFDGVVSAEVLSAELRATPPEDGARTLMLSLLALVADGDLVHVD